MPSGTYELGSIVKKLKKMHAKSDKILAALKDLIDEDCDGEPEESEEWTRSVDGDGLIFICTNYLYNGMFLEG